MTDKQSAREIIPGLMQLCLGMTYDQTEWLELCDKAGIDPHDDTAIALAITQNMPKTLEGDKSALNLMLGALSNHIDMPETKITAVNNADGTDPMKRHDKREWLQYGVTVNALAAFIMKNNPKGTDWCKRNIRTIPQYKDYIEFNGEMHVDDIFTIIAAGKPLSMNKASIRSGIARCIMTALNNGFTYEQFIRTVLWFNGRCAYCGHKMTDSGDRRRTGDHIIPIANPVELGIGETIFGNVIICCHACNADKDHLELGEWLNRRFEPTRAARIHDNIHAFMDYAGYKPMTPDCSRFAMNEIHNLQSIPIERVTHDVIRNAIGRINDYRKGNNLKESAIKKILVNPDKASAKQQQQNAIAIKWLDNALNQINMIIAEKRKHRAKNGTIIKALMNKCTFNDKITALDSSIDLNALYTIILHIHERGMEPEQANTAERLAILQSGKCIQCRKPLTSYKIKTVDGTRMLMCKSCGIQSPASPEQWLTKNNEQALNRIGWHKSK